MSKIMTPDRGAGEGKVKDKGKGGYYYADPWNMGFPTGLTIEEYLIQSLSLRSHERACDLTEMEHRTTALLNWARADLKLVKRHLLAAQERHKRTE